MDDYRVLLSPRALRDLDGIYEYISNTLSERAAAEALIGDLERAVLSLASFPQRCAERRVGRFSDSGYRQMFVKNYCVIFRIDEQNKEVIVLTVVYSRRNV